MANIIDPSKLTGTLNALAENIAKQEGNKALVDTDHEISIFSSSAQAMIDSGQATDFTQNDLNEILGIKFGTGLKVPEFSGFKLQSTEFDNIGNKIEKYVDATGFEKVKKYSNDGKLNEVIYYPSSDKANYEKIIICAEEAKDGYEKVVYKDNMIVQDLLYDKKGVEYYCIDYKDDGSRVISDDYKDDGTCRVQVYNNGELLNEYRNGVHIDKIDAEDL